MGPTEKKIYEDELRRSPSIPGNSTPISKKEYNMSIVEALGGVNFLGYCIGIHLACMVIITVCLLFELFSG